MWTTLVNKLKSGIEWTGLYYFDGNYTYRTIELDNAPVAPKKVETFVVTPVKVTDEDLAKVKKPRKPRAKKATKTAKKPKKS